MVRNVVRNVVRNMVRNLVRNVVRNAEKQQVRHDPSDLSPLAYRAFPMGSNQRDHWRSMGSLANQWVHSGEQIIDMTTGAGIDQ